MVGVLRAVVGDEQRAALVGVRMAPAQGREVGAQDPAAKSDGFGSAQRFGVEPGRWPVAAKLEHRLLAPGAGRAEWILGVDDPLRAAAPVDELELVLEPVDIRHGGDELPGAAAARKAVRQTWNLVRELDAREPRAPLAIDEADRALVVREGSRGGAHRGTSIGKLSGAQGRARTCEGVPIVCQECRKTGSFGR